MKIETINRDTKGVSVGIFVPVGSAHEMENERGLAHFIEHMLFKGTTRRTYRDIAVEMDRLGGMINAFTGREFTCFFIKVLRDYLDEAFDVLTDIVSHSLIDESELEKEKGVILEEINMTEDTPDDHVFDVFMENAVTTKLRYPILGKRELIESYTREDLLRFMGKYYKPENFILAAVGGDVDSFDFGINGEFIFRDYFEQSRIDKVPFGFKSGVDVVHRELNATNVVMGTPLVGRNDDRRFAATLLNDMLGGTMSSRLFQRVREELSLCYHVSSSLSLYENGGLLTISSATSNETAQKLVDAVKLEIERLKKDYVSSTELKNAKTHYKGSYALSVENNHALMMKLGMDNVMYGRYIDEDYIFHMIDRVGVDDIVELVDMINLDNFHITALGRIEGLKW